MFNLKKKLLKLSPRDFVKNWWIILFLSLLIVYGRFLLPGPKVAHDFPVVSKEIIETGFNLPFVWSAVSNGLGQYVISTLWSWPLGFLYGTLAQIGFGFTAQEILLGILPILIIGVFGLRKLFNFYGITGWGRILGIFFYLSNSYILLLIDGGQIQIALAYAWMPLAFILFEQSSLGRIKERLLAGIALIILGVFDLRFVYILLMLLGLRLIFILILSKKLDRISLIFGWSKSFIITLFLLVIANIYWILPLFAAKPPLAPPSYTRAEEVATLSFASLGHALLLQQPHWFKNMFGQISSLNIEFILIPFLVFLAPLLKRKDLNVGFWLVIACLGIFLSKGAQEPFAGIYLMLFAKIPGFSIFRDPTKFYFLTALAYSILIGFSIEQIIKNFKIFFPKIIMLFPFIILFYFLWLIRPAYFGWMTGTFSTPSYQKEYKGLADILSGDNNFSRVLWIPNRASLGYSSLNHPQLDAFTLTQKRPFIIGTKGTYETFNFLREAPYIGEILNITGVGYIAYPLLDAEKDEINSDKVHYYYTFLEQLSKLPWVSGIDQFSKIPLIKTKEHQQQFFVAQDLWWVLGSDDIYQESTKSAEFSLSKNALIFADEYLGLGNRATDLVDAKVVLNHKGDLDLAASFINQQEVLFPASKLGLNPDKSGWWKRTDSDVASWRGFLRNKYNLDNQDFSLGGGWAVSEGSLSLEIQDSRIEKGKVLLTRAMESSRGGELQFYQNQEYLGKISTRTGDENLSSNVRWFEVGNLGESNNITIKTSGDINVVNAVAILSPQHWEGYKRAASDLKKTNRVKYYGQDLTTNLVQPKVKYEMINPTKYKVQLSGIKSPAMLIFSQSYDSFWSLNGQNSVPVYSLVNGFRVDKDGEYILELKTQEYTKIGLIIMGLLLPVFAIILLSRKSLK